MLILGTAFILIANIGECPLIQSFVDSNSFCKCDTSFWISIGSIVVSAIFLILSLFLKGYTTSAKKPRDAKDSGSKNLDSNSSQTKEQEEFLDEIKQNSSRANSNGGMSLYPNLLTTRATGFIRPANNGSNR